MKSKLLPVTDNMIKNCINILWYKNTWNALGSEWWWLSSHSVDNWIVGFMTALAVGYTPGPQICWSILNMFYFHVTAQVVCFDEDKNHKSCQEWSCCTFIASCYTPDFPDLLHSWYLLCSSFMCLRCAGENKKSQYWNKGEVVTLSYIASGHTF